MKGFIFIFTIIFFFIPQSYASNPHFHEPIIAQFFGIWTERGQVWEQKFREDTPFEKLNRLYIAFGKVVKTSDDHYSLGFDGEAARVKAIIARMKKVNPQAEIFFVVGGTGSESSFGGAAKDAKFTENVLQFLHQYGFTGLDIDWEMGLDKYTLNKLVTHLSQSLHINDIKLTLDVWPYVTPAYDMVVLKENLDQINIMSYGTGLSVARCAQSFVQAGFPMNKIIGGIETEADYHQFGGVADTLGVNGTIAEKAKYALDHHMAGMMAWRLDNDYAPSENRNLPTYQGAIELYKAMVG